MSQKSELPHSSWRGLRASAHQQLIQRDYQSSSLETRLASSGTEVSHILAAEQSLRAAGVWIPGVELIPRVVYPQYHRGVFGEFARQGEGVLGRIGLWPTQWATARMTAGTAKGFHIHPPFIPDGKDAEAWFLHLYGQSTENFTLRPYDREQWDVMFFVQGRIEFFLVDEREGLPRRIMRFFLEGDNHRGPNNIGIVIPAGVAHALRTESSEDAIMVYGTSTCFNPTNEGRISSHVEQASLPTEWERYLKCEK